ncbi:MAG: CPBP family intramembrane metalloprotease [Gemmatimonadaceae bacterium]|nr:CPBP family intramembrane metalloprotease [Gemmatimonadaceae bacterium]
MSPADSGELRAAPAPASANVAERPRLSVGWRFAVFVLASSVGVLGCRAVIPAAAALLEVATGVRLPAFVITLSVGLLIGHWWTFRQVEPDGWHKVLLDRSAFSWRALGGGALLGASAVGVPSVLLLAIGWLKLEPMPAGSVLASAFFTLGLLAPAALWEELVARGYALALLRERFGARVAIAVTSVAFGLMHLENRGATFQSIALVTLAGIFLGSIVVAMRSLYAAWSAHVAWNFVMAGVMHTSVSGLGMGTPNYRTVDAGPDWATGGMWGPEAGVFAGAGMLVAMFFLLRRRDHPVQRDASDGRTDA